ncbi:trichohyalin-like [Paralichthys olivaceus]|uniref:trichohyalin-like n=1 Tax=Paralichthys olivaceus TaxID=8255 RepID=UPI003752882E
MSTRTRGRLTGQRQGNTQTQQDVVPGRGADGVDCPFPNKPLCHRRPFNPRTQDLLDLKDFEKITITKPPRGSVLPQDHHLNDIGETTGSQHRRKDSHRLSSGEDQVARAIQAKKVMIQETLLRVEEKLRQKINGVEATTSNDELKREERRGRGQPERAKAQTNTRLLIQERRQQDFKQLGRRQDQQPKDKMKGPQEEEGGRWKRRETKVAERPHNISVIKQKVSGEQNKLRWKNVKEHTGRKGDEKDHFTGREASLRPQDRIEEGKDREQKKTSTGWTEEKKYRQKTYEDMQSYIEQDMPQINQTADTLVEENHRGEERRISRKSSLPPVSSPPTRRPLREELEVESSDSSSKLLPCGNCNRTFASERLEKHLQICKKRKPSRQVFSSYAHRLKGSANGEYMKSHSRSKTPEVIKKKSQRQNNKSKTKNV